MKGSYTAEAACVCPLILFSLVFLWYLGFYQHNRIACQAICREAVYKGLDAERDERDGRAAALAVLSAQSGNLFSVDDIRTEATVSGKVIKASMTVRMHFPFGIWKGNGAGGDWVIEEHASLVIEHPAKVIRNLRRWNKGEET